MHVLVYLKDIFALGEQRKRVLGHLLVLGSVSVYILAETSGDGIWRVEALSKYSKFLLSNCLANN